MESEEKQRKKPRNKKGKQGADEGKDGEKSRKRDGKRRKSKDKRKSSGGNPEPRIHAEGHAPVEGTNSVEDTRPGLGYNDSDFLPLTLRAKKDKKRTRADGYVPVEDTNAVEDTKTVEDTRPVLDYNDSDLLSLRAKKDKKGNMAKLVSQIRAQQLAQLAQMKSDKEDQMRDVKVVGLHTDDFKIRRLVSSTNDLPLHKYNALGAILLDRKNRHAFEDAPIPVVDFKKDIISKKHTLGPLQPGKPEILPDEEPTDTDKKGKKKDAKEDKERAGLHSIGPTPFKEEKYCGAIGGDDRWDQPHAPHDGVLWPLAWAPTPPYTTPGYKRLGVRQPTGLIQVDRIPVDPSVGRTEDGEFELPTWVSPLYRPYGIGGPFGPFGPFYEPPTMSKAENNPVLTLPPKKCLLKRMFSMLKKDKMITNVDKGMYSYLKFLDENLIAMRHMLRMKKDNKEIMISVVQHLGTILETSKKYADNMDIGDGIGIAITTTSTSTKQGKSGPPPTPSSGEETDSYSSVSSSK